MKNRLWQTLLCLAPFMVGPVFGQAPIYFTDKNGRIISENNSHIFQSRWAASSVSVESYPGGPKFRIDTELYALNAKIPNRISHISIYLDGALLTEMSSAELAGLENPKLARMQVETYGKGNRDLILTIPIQTQCGNSDAPSDMEYSETLDNGKHSDAVNYNGEAYVSIVRFLDHPEIFQHHIGVFKCDPDLRPATKDPSP